MARIIGGIATSHAPQLLMPALKWSELPTRTKGPFHPKPGIADELTDAAKLAKEARCRAALERLKAQLYAWSPDAVIVVGDDQHENILDDNMPPFVIYAADEVGATLHFTYLGEKSIDQVTRYRAQGELARQLLEGLMDEGFDPAWSKKTREEFGLGHAFGRALKFLMPDGRFAVVPLMVNTYYPPAPSAARCLALGDAIRTVVGKLPGAARLVVLASGGLSHTVIDEAYDEAFMAALARNDRAAFAAMKAEDLIEGTSEIRNWIIAAGALNRGAAMIDYVPCYRQPSGVGCAMGFAVWKD